MLVILAFYVVCLWKVFEKAGQPGWAAIVPIYNIVILLQIVGRPTWWVILMLIPCVNIIIALLVYLDLARVFGKGAGFGVGLFLLGIIFLPILAFGDAEYTG
ncbi:MAG: signal peptidase I [Bacteroidetes bacterium]|nr:signal peptidase I [Bacteroidota bacterium]